MATLTAAKKVIVRFFVEEFDLPQEAILVQGLTKTDEGWKGQVRVTQTNPHLKVLGYPPVYDNNCYNITLDHGLEVNSYWLDNPGKEED
jgi:hypothetical protein